MGTLNLVLNKIGRIDLCQDFRHSDSGREHPDPESERLAGEFGVPPRASRGGLSLVRSVCHIAIVYRFAIIRGAVTIVERCGGKNAGCSEDMKIFR